MFKSYLKTAFRYLLKNKVFTLINIVGLAVGLVCSFLIVLHVSTELSYDKHYQDAEDIYRLAVRSSMGDNQFEAAVTGGPLAITLQNEIPEITGHTRLREGRLTLLAHGENSFYEEKILFADSNFFSLFDFPMIYGNPLTALDVPRSVVLKESLAKKFFGDSDPVGQQLKWNNEVNYTVTAVVADVREKSHLDFDMLVSFSTLYENQRFKTLLQSYFAYTTLNYIKLREKCDPNPVLGKIHQVVDTYMGEGLAEYDGKYEVFLQPLTSIYLHSDLLHELKPSSSISGVYIFSGIAILILLIAGINFINLATARSQKRAMEVGLRKVFGADRAMIFRQYMVESLLTVLVSTFISLILFDVFLPVFNRLSGNNFIFTQLFRLEYLLVMIPGVVLVGLVAGIYPSLYLSGFKPVSVMKKYISGGKSQAYFRNTLVVVQFVISVFLLAGTLLINRQLNYIDNKDLGVDQKDVVVLSLRSSSMAAQYETAKAEMENVPGVLDATGSSAYLGQFQQRRGFYKEGQGLKDMVLTLYVQVDQNYTDFFRAKISQGRNFFEHSRADSNAILINRAYLEQLGWENPIGKQIFIPGQTENESIPLKIVGVVEDFNYASLHQEVKPLIIMNASNRASYMSLKINPTNTKEVLELIAAKWENLFPQYPFEYFLQQSVYEEMYRSEVNMGRLFKYFSILALFIAVLGLLGLSAYSVEQRTKEIGVRKVLGSSVREVLLLMTRDFSKWVVLAILIAVPITFFAMDQWLSHFEFHTNISWDIFLVSGLLAFSIAYLTILVQAYKASNSNPVDSLKYE